MTDASAMPAALLDQSHHKRDPDVPTMPSNDGNGEGTPPSAVGRSATVESERERLDRRRSLIDPCADIEHLANQSFAGVSIRPVNGRRRTPIDAPRKPRRSRGASRCRSRKLWRSVASVLVVARACSGVSALIKTSAARASPGRSIRRAQSTTSVKRSACLLRRACAARSRSAV
jgi:hypothetical protein